MGKDALFDGESVLEFRSGSDRRSFLRWAGLVGVGAALAGGATAVPAAAEERARQRGDIAPESDDLGILNYALTLEYLEADFYRRGLDHGLVQGRELELVEPIAAHEQAHVDGLRELITSLGGKPVESPHFRYPFLTFRSRFFFLRQASKFEELGVNAYHGQVPLVSSPEVLGAAASIAGVESRHAAILATLSFRDPFPAPIEEPKSMEEVLPVVKQFIADGGDAREEEAR